MQLLTILLVFTCCQLVLGKTDTFFAAMDSGGKYNVTWSFDDVKPDSYVTFTVTCETSGWIGLGMSPKGTMDDADIVFAWVDSTGKAFLKDTYAEGHGVPVEDPSQDVQLISAVELNGVTTVAFKRKISSCDKDKDHNIMTSTTRLIYAYASEDPADNMISKAKRHHTRGVKSLYLLDPTSKVETLPDDVKHFDMRVNNYKIPSVHTTYYCKFFDAPVLESTHHIVAAEPLLTQGNEALVHHILIYGCWGVSKEHMRNNNKTEGVCFTSEMPEFEENCRNPIHAWAVGGTTFYFPPNTGYSIGASDGSTPEYFMMEIHYDNPERLDSYVDSSGIRFTYTPTLRLEDTGILSIGMVFGIVVPPQPERFRIVSFCDGNCTQKWIPDEGITVYSYFLHTHLLGVQIDLELYRDGKHLGMFAQDKAYDFNFQEWRLLPMSKKVLPGDTMKITCTYTDPSRNKVTYGGLPSSDEMCLAFLMYYPKQRISSCGTLPNLLTSPQDEFYKTMNLNAAIPGSSFANLAVANDVKNWTGSAVTMLQGAFENTQQYTVCQRTSEESFSNSLRAIDPKGYKTVVDEEVKDSTACDDDNNASALFPALLSLLTAFLLIAVI